MQLFISKHKLYSFLEIRVFSANIFLLIDYNTFLRLVVGKKFHNYLFYKNILKYFPEMCKYNIQIQNEY